MSKPLSPAARARLKRRLTGSGPDPRTGKTISVDYAGPVPVGLGNASHILRKLRRGDVFVDDLRPSAFHQVFLEFDVEDFEMADGRPVLDCGYVVEWIADQMRDEGLEPWDAALAGRQFHPPYRLPVAPSSSDYAEAAWVVCLRLQEELGALHVGGFPSWWEDFDAWWALNQVPLGTTSFTDKFAPEEPARRAPRVRPKLPSRLVLDLSEHSERQRFLDETRKALLAELAHDGIVEIVSGYATTEEE